jgi:acyl-CoA thioester hydrolase
MFVQETKIRVRYGETDQMGYVYYGNYALYYEVGRVEALRTIGFSYKELEARGVMLPVLSLEIKYIRPALYDDLLTVRTTISEVPHTRIRFQHEVFNEQGTLLNKGAVELVFVDAQTMRPAAAPDYFLELMHPYFRESDKTT